MPEDKSPRFIPAIHDVLGVPVQRPYDWSNRGKISPEVLIACIFKSGIFQDLINVTIKFGLPRVRAVADVMMQTDTLNDRAKKEMLANVALIEKHIHKQQQLKR
ncbi:hypothetical protein [Jeongeupia naejangsanensis]|uniref:Uncharacterized protein n=1 Tax=Jeongeupia naejangsanensis TaxID=613195 RepID=A0ABS2BLC8_9NEIS|nr:hypothetical protein [Jeongeupia naejangsanensis]MBM3116415.1 hypothetical protein [Jeongeupia naejangsanensis]